MRDLKLLPTLGIRGKDQPNDKLHKRFPYFLGVELELEAVGGDIVENTPRGWNVHVDESLRNGGLEFVFNNPYEGDHAIQAVENFYATKGNYNGGPRTSTHVHVNAAPLTVGALRAIVALSYIIEDSLFAVLKEFRKWCGYCMPLTEMHQSRLRILMSSEDANTFHTYGIRAANNADKYYGLNVSSLRKHGTLEYRYFPGAPSKEELLDWMDYCTEMTVAGIKLEGPETLLSIDDPAGLEAFIMDAMPKWGERLIAVHGIMPIFERLHDLQCLLEHERGDPVKRHDPLIFVSPQLIGLACRIFGTNKGQRDTISGALKEMKVMSRTEWEHTIIGGGYADPGVYAKKVGAPKKRLGGFEGLINVADLQEQVMPQAPNYEDVFARLQNEARQNDLRLQEQYRRMRNAAAEIPQPAPDPQF